MTETQKRRAQEWTFSGAIAWIEQFGGNWSVVALDLSQRNLTKAIKHRIVVSNHGPDRDAATAAASDHSVKMVCGNV